MKIDPRSDRVALHYTGSEAGEPAVSGVPARDLTENDLARLVFIEHGDLSGAARAAASDKLVDRLTSGPYRKTPPIHVAAKRAGQRAGRGVRAKDLSVRVTPTTTSTTTTVAGPIPAEPSVDSAEGEPS